METIEESIRPDGEILKPCSVCGRTFRIDTLERHERICQRNAEKKRKIFDSKKQRAVGTELTSHTEAKQETNPEPRKETLKRRVKPAPKVKSKSNWREKHEELIRTIRRSREPNKANTEPSDAKSYIPSDYVQCPGCGRHFNQKAAERHIPWCQKKKSQTLKSPTGIEDAKEKLKARIKYRVPPPVKGRKKDKKPKTAGSVETEENRSPVVRESGSYSSPPSFLSSRNLRSNTSNVQNNQTQSYTKKREPRNGSRSRENKSVTPPEISTHAIKFKDRFPNHTFKRSIDLEESFNSLQLQEIFNSHKTTDDRGPKTVPGLRLGSNANNHNFNDNANYKGISVNSSGSSNSSSSGSWNKQIVGDTVLPEVSSSELSGPWTGKLCWNGDLEGSLSSSGSSSSSGSLPPLSRESPSEGQPGFYCHQCNHKFPLIMAKYCCECGARRRGVGAVSQSG